MDVTRPAEKHEFESFSQFYPFYVSQHHLRATRVIHTAGSLLGLSVATKAIVRGPRKQILAFPVISYSCAWFSHFFIEKNVPATFGYTRYSLMGDWVMVAKMVTGKDGETQELADQWLRDHPGDRPGSYVADPADAGPSLADQVPPPGPPAGPRVTLDPPSVTIPAAASATTAEPATAAPFGAPLVVPTDGPLNAPPPTGSPAHLPPPADYSPGSAAPATPPAPPAASYAPPAASAVPYAQLAAPMTGAVMTASLPAMADIPAQASASSLPQASPAPAFIAESVAASGPAFAPEPAPLFASAPVPAFAPPAVPAPAPAPAPEMAEPVEPMVAAPSFAPTPVVEATPSPAAAPAPAPAYAPIPNSYGSWEATASPWEVPAEVSPAASSSRWEQTAPAMGFAPPAPAAAAAPASPDSFAPPHSARYHLAPPALSSAPVASPSPWASM